MTGSREIAKEPSMPSENFSRPVETSGNHNLSLVGLLKDQSSERSGNQSGATAERHLKASITMTNIYPKGEAGINFDRHHSPASDKSHHAGQPEHDISRETRRFSRKEYQRAGAGADAAAERLAKEKGASSGDAKPSASAFVYAAKESKASAGKQEQGHDAWDPAFDPLRKGDHKSQLDAMRPKYVEQAAMFDLVRKIEQVAEAGREGRIEELPLIGAEVVLLAVIVSSAVRRQLDRHELEKPAQASEEKARKTKDNTKRSDQSGHNEVFRHLADKPWLGKFLKNTFAAAQDRFVQRQMSGNDKADKEPPLDVKGSRQKTLGETNPIRENSLSELFRRVREKQEAVSIADQNSRPFDDVIVRPVWLVRPGEDLVKLAEQLFHDARMAWLIAEINEGFTRQTVMDSKLIVELRVRDRIEIPVWQDIVRFRREGRRLRDADRLITVVRQTAVDRQLVEHHLAPAMGVAPVKQAEEFVLKPQPALT